MNSVKTKFILDISRKLAAAPDSDAKIDLVDELSDNLYARYNDMIADGMSESDAYATALDKLGDVNELLAYLDACGDNSSAESQSRGMDSDAWFDSLNGFVGKTIGQARDAVKDAASIVRDAAKYLDNSARVTLRTDDISEMNVPSEGLVNLKINLTGDFSLCVDDNPDARVHLDGDIDDLLVHTEGDTLVVEQDTSAGGSFLFSRGLSSATVEMTIPQRPWQSIRITTTSGDVELCRGPLELDSLSMKTTSGDMEVQDLPHTGQITVSTASGDLNLYSCTCGQLRFQSASGDLEGESLTAETVSVQTASGDVDLSGDIRALKADTASGDLSFTAETLPEAVELSAKSGDCSLCLPDCDGFIFRFATISGELHSDFPLTTSAPQARNRGRRSGEAYYKDGGDGRVFSLSSTSGDIELGKR